ncbi:hypothetical protein H312_00218, partial [Anncaliia algerae PRA339]
MSEKTKALKQKECEMNLIKKELHLLFTSYDIYLKQKVFIFREMDLYKMQVESLKKRLNEYSTDVGGTKIIEDLTKEIAVKNGMISDLQNKLVSTSGQKEKISLSEHSLKLRENLEQILLENASKEKTEEFLSLQSKIHLLKEEYEKEIDGYKKEIFNLKTQNKLLENKVIKYEKEATTTEMALLKERELHQKYSQIQTDSFLEMKVNLENILESKIKEISKIKPEYEFLKKNSSITAAKVDNLSLVIAECKKNWQNYQSLVYNSKNITDDTLIDELGNLSSAFDSMSKSYNGLLQRVDEYFKKIEELEKANLDLSIQYEEKINYLKTFTSDNSDHFMIYMEKLLETNELRLKLSQSESNLLNLRKKYEALILELESEKESNNNLNIKLIEYRRRVEEKNNEMNSEKARVLESENTNKLLKKIVYSIVEDGSADVFDELEKYKKLFRCMACDVNHKDTVITKCMHVFCHECIDKRLKTRLRKCPNCGEEFHVNDVQKIYL